MIRLVEPSCIHTYVVINGGGGGGGGGGVEVPVYMLCD